MRLGMCGLGTCRYVSGMCLGMCRLGTSVVRGTYKHVSGDVWYRMYNICGHLYKSHIRDIKGPQCT